MKNDFNSPAAAGVPWLEFFPQQGGPVQKTLVATFPFSIGRNDTTDLPINSTRVSREHAAIVKAGNTYRVRDLDSTNGTFVNGQRIEEATLSDGDILMIADVEFTFFSGNTQAARKTVTQVIGFRESDSSSLKGVDLIRCVRRLQETILQGSSRLEYQPVVDLLSDTPIGYEAIQRLSHGGPYQLEADRLVLATNSRLAVRIRECFFLLAAEKLTASDKQAKLFLHLESSEIDHEFVRNLLGIAERLFPRPDRLVLDLPDSVVNDIPYFHEIHAWITDFGAELCYSEFAAGKAQVEVHRKVPPNYLRLARAMVRGIAQDDDRQALIKSTIRTCRDSGCEVIATNLDQKSDVQLFQQLGCRFGMGKHFATTSEAEPANCPPTVIAPLQGGFVGCGMAVSEVH
ncbi:MAG: EAL domain-containing protein [Planctomycetota bacterium]|nr:EAL domain-containing protein [Planctomycetota bacterium]